MMNLPRRPELTDDSARNTPLRPLLSRVDKFTRQHPEYRIAAPYNTRSGLWEVRRGDDLSQYDNGFRMMLDLETRYAL